MGIARLFRKQARPTSMNEPLTPEEETAIFNTIYNYPSVNYGWIIKHSATKDPIPICFPPSPPPSSTNSMDRAQTPSSTAATSIDSEPDLTSLSPRLQSHIQKLVEARVEQVIKEKFRALARVVPRNNASTAQRRISLISITNFSVQAPRDIHDIRDEPLEDLARNAFAFLEDSEAEEQVPEPDQSSPAAPALLTELKAQSISDSPKLTSSLPKAGFPLSDFAAQVMDGSSATMSICSTESQPEDARVLISRKHQSLQQCESPSTPMPHCGRLEMSPAQLLNRMSAPAAPQAELKQLQSVQCSLTFRFSDNSTVTMPSHEVFDFELPMALPRLARPVSLGIF